MTSISRRSLLQRALLAATAMPGISMAAGETLTRHPRGGVSQAVDFSQVVLTDGFWRPKQWKVATVTLNACIVQTEQKTARIRNFERAARRAGEAHEGIYFDDSDVYKALEAIAYSLKNRPDPVLEAKADEWIAKIAAAQLPDGYLNTYFILRGLEQRWTDMEKHEDYCAGHLIEAGVAYYRTTGKRVLLDVGIRFADHLDATFRRQNRHWVSGHEEIELALIKLHVLTGEPRYLQLAAWYLDQRGRGYGHGDLWGPGKDPGYCQDRLPVREEARITGHAVRAMYLYSAVADVAAMTGDAGYRKSLDLIWQDVVYRNLYVTGGIGSSGQNEGFSQDFDLPNEQAYCETCASVGMVFWNHRMALLTGESRYVDVLERTLYNAALDGLSLSGDRFFYGNPLAAAHSRNHGRSAWFGTACCPSNIARLVSSLGGYVYSVAGQDLWINLFVANRTRLTVAGAEIAVEMTTDYPWDGRLRLTLGDTARRRLRLHVRIPGWARSEAVPGDLYRFSGSDDAPVELRLNGSDVRHSLVKGYAVIEREWRSGDTLELVLPMPVRRLTARAEIGAAAGRQALQRGPVVYCVEGADNDSHAWDFFVAPDAAVNPQTEQILDEQVIALTTRATGLKPRGDGLAVESEARIIKAIPYYTWANRGNFDMQVWLPTRIDGIKIES